MAVASLLVAILGGGLATRLRPITERIPKSLIEIAGKPFIAHQLELLRNRGVDRAVLCVGHLGEMVRQFVGDGGRWGLKVDYSFDGEKLLGTAGALRKALPLLGDAFFVLYGDSYLDTDYRAVQDTFEKSGKLGLMTVLRNQGRWDRSNILFKDGCIIDYNKSEKCSGMEHVDYGLCVFRREAFADIPPGEPCDLVKLCQGLLSRGQLAAHEVTERFYEIGSHEGLADTRKRLMEKE